MLCRLVIHDVVLIDKLAVSFEPGLNVFTGETGAGKSILLDALGLALGGRSDAGLIRQGASQASVTAEFVLDITHRLFELAQEQGLSAENPVILRRVIGKDGKSRGFFNDQPISIGLLKQLGDTLLEVHGQFETHGLLNPATHRELLDAFAGLEGLRNKVGEAFKLWDESSTNLETAKAVSDRVKNEEDFLRAAVTELQQLAPQNGESETLAQRRIQLQHREKIFEALSSAIQSLENERGAIAALTQAGKAVSRVSDKVTGLSDVLATIDRASIEANEACHQLSVVLSSLNVESDALEKIEERLFALRAVARKHGTQVEMLADTLQNLSERLSLLSDEENQLKKLEERANYTRQIYATLAKELSVKRKSAGEKLKKAIEKELPPLKLEKAKFTIDVIDLPETLWSAEGINKVAFLASTNPGTAEGSLQKIASGGELARFMLAIKTVLSAVDPVSVLVFDEVDTGIGGAVASAVGERLELLADSVQILVVTHSPQVAARGVNHLRVIKRVKANKTVTEIETLDKTSRREEIARMLAGTHITEAARKAADSLIGDVLPKKRA